MGNRSEQEFYERLNEIDSPDSGRWIGIAIIFGLSGLVVGLVIGYIVVSL